jgi:hypothetical protein
MMSKNSQEILVWIKRNFQKFVAGWENPKGRWLSFSQFHSRLYRVLSRAGGIFQRM